MGILIFYKNASVEIKILEPLESFFYEYDASKCGIGWLVGWLIWLIWSIIWSVWIVRSFGRIS